MGIATGTKINIGGFDYWSQNGNTSWGLNLVSDDTFRFEVRARDQWYRDPNWKERSELTGDVVFNPGETLTISYSFMIEPGKTNTADWLVIGQFHADDSFTSPPFAVELIGDKMAIVVRHPIEGTSKYKTQYVFVDDQNIQRGKYYDIKITVNFENNSNGFLNVWRDGKQIVDYDGPIGYGYGVYWKHGIYREESKETLAINYKNFSLTTDGGVVILGTNSADTVTTSKSPTGQPTPTDKGDVMIMKGSHDVIVAGSGPDVILSGKGNDKINAGKGHDKLFGGPGNDKLKGGAGKDVFKFAPDFGKNVIRDFKPNKDKVLFDGVFDGYRDLKGHMTKHTGGTLIEDGGDSVFLSKVKLSKLDADDFLFL